MPGSNQAIDEQGYDTPTPIEAKAIPAILEKRDVMAAAEAGTGKTAGFTLPMLEMLALWSSKTQSSPRLSVNTTRELAAQVWQSVATYSKHLNYPAKWFMAE